MKILAAALLAWLLIALVPARGHPQRPSIPPSIFKAVRAHWTTRPERVRAFDVAYCESKFNRKAVSRTGDYGVFQINRQAHDNWVDFSARIFSPVYNVYVARRMYLSAKARTGDGWYPWRPSRSCWG